MTLDRYIAWRFLWMFARVFAGFAAIMFTLDMIEQLRRFADPGISLREAGLLAAMNAPASLYRILPLILILSAIALFVGLARSSELVVIRAAGRSGLRFLLAPLISALLVGAVAVAVFNPLVAATSKRYDALSSGHARGGSVLSVTETGIWLRQGDASGQTVIHAARANLDGTLLFDPSFLIFDAEGKPLERIEAVTASLESGAQLESGAHLESGALLEAGALLESGALLEAGARPDAGAWRLSGAKSWPLDHDNPERDARILTDGASVATDLTRDKIRDGFGTPSAISIWNLPGYIAALDRAGFSARSHRVWFQMELALPLFLVAMVLIAAGFTMQHARAARTGSMVLLALLGGFAVFFLRNFGQVLGDNGQIPILVAAWTPPVAAALLALGLILHLEDG